MLTSESLLNDETGQITLFPSWYQDSKTLFSKLSERTDWKTRKVTVFGKQHPIPRLEMWTGEPGVEYTYSGMVYRSEGWLPPLDQIAQRLSQEMGWKPNSALLNKYRDGKDKMGWHSDDEPELGRYPNLAILSLGSSRRLDFRLKRDHPQKLKIQLPEGSLLMISGAVQEYWQHGLQPKANVGERISCTFRLVKN